MRLLFSIFLMTLCFTSFSQFKEVQTDNIPAPHKDQIEVNPVKRSNIIEELPSVNYEFLNEYNLRSLTADQFTIKAWNKDRPIFIEGILSDVDHQGGIKLQAEQYLKEIAPLLKIDDTQSEFILQRYNTDDIGMDHLRYTQHYKGIKVLGGELILHAENGVINFANGYTYATCNIDNVIPTLSAEEIKSIIEKNTPSQVLTENQKKFAGEKWDLELVIYHDDKNKEALLAYQVVYRPNLLDRYIYTLDAHTGKEISKHNAICKFHNHGDKKSCNHTSVDFKSNNSKLNPLLLENDETFHSYSSFLGAETATATDLLGVNRLINTYEQSGTYYMIDASRDMYQASSDIFNSNGIIITLDALGTSPENNNFDYVEVQSTNNSWNDRTSVSAHYNAGRAFEYFKDTHNRNSIDGNGGNVFSLIHVSDENGNGLDNAFWNGQAMWYGDGNQAFKPLARGLDVAGHEISHGVVQSTANLTYQGESGALNESFADVFGAMIDRDDWQMGEDVVESQFFPSGALRDLQDPHNGATSGDYQGGFQPKHVNEQFTGNEDNGGVHINSGIPNHAFYLFANAIGKDKAEKVWYRALTNYLTASSQFIDLRIATIRATEDLYGNTEVNALKSAMDNVGILDGEGGSYQNDVNLNSGEDFLVLTDIENQDVFIANLNDSQVVKISDKNPISKPSITDDGGEIVFIADDKKMHYIRLTWNGDVLENTEEFVLQDEAVWRNVIISRDGNRIAALFDDLAPRIWVYDFTIEGSNEYDLYNPTTSSGGNTTGDVNFADAMEFDFTGEWIMYDAQNEIQGSGATNIQYWDIGFVRVWNNAINSWSLGDISKLFSALPDDVSVGNPTFSKNSPYIIAFDYIESGNLAVLGYNLETSEDGLIRAQQGLGYPSFSRVDDAVVYDDTANGTLGGVGISDIDETKILGSNPGSLSTAFRWPVWFGNGDRLSNLEDLKDDISGLSLYPNPSTGVVNLSFTDAEKGSLSIEVFTLLGNKVYGDVASVKGGKQQISITFPEELPAGTYVVKLSTKERTGSSTVQLIR